MKNLFDLLATHGGKIINSNDATVLEIADARVDSRMFVDDMGLGFIFMPKDYAEYRKAVFGVCFQTN